MKRTKIVCTIGPATAEPRMMERLIAAGMDVARLNFSHGSYADHGRLIRRLRAASAKTGRPVGILQDLQGPKIRVGALPEKGVTLVAGKTAVFTTGAPTGGKIPVGYARLAKDVKKGEHILLDDGLLEVVVVGVRGKDVTTKVAVGGLLTSHKGMNLPGTALSVSAISAKDRQDLRFGVTMGVDFVALSFVRSAKDVRELRRLLAAAERGAGKRTGPPIMIVVKIEKAEALKNFDAILAEADAVMVARGDLGVETSAADVPIRQKEMIKKCLAAAKPVIVATQMLDSMIRNPRPTRAEVSDVANAVIDHTDAVMLSGETATGKYPLEAVTTMATVAQETEASVFDDLHLHARHAAAGSSVEAAIGESAGTLARATVAKAIVGSTMTGATARQVSRFRPEIPVFMAAPEGRVLRQLTLSWGVRPFAARKTKDATALRRAIYATLKRGKALRKGDQTIYVSGAPGTEGESDSVTIDVVP